MARPVSEKYKIDFVIDTINNYIDNTELPIFKEVCYLNDWNPDRIYQLSQESEELLCAIKKCHCKKEVELEKGALTGKYNATMAVFSLKQLGWKDKQEIDVASNIDSVSVKVDTVDEKQIDRVRKLQENLFKNET